jgi:acyl-CoA dehydrogenase
LGPAVDFEPNEDHELIRQAVGQVCSHFPDDYWLEREDKHEFPWEFYRAMAEGGWIGIAIPEDYGGGGRGVDEASIVLQAVAQSGAGMNGASAIHLSVFGMHPVVVHGREEMKRRYLPGVASGEVMVAFGVTEPDAGSDTPSITTRAIRHGDGFRITGRKVWTSRALESQMVILLARTSPPPSPEKRTQGLSLFLVDLASEGIDIRPIPKMGRNAVRSCEVYYDDVYVPVDDLVGEEGDGFRYLLSGLNAERVLVAAEAIGLGFASIARAVDYAKDRVVFGRPIGSNQGIAFPLAQAYAQLTAAELLVRKAAWRLDRHLPVGADANLAKYLAAEAGFFAADRAVQTHGGFGYAKEYHVERYFRESRLLRIAPLSQELLLAYIAQHALGLPRSY